MCLICSGKMSYFLYTGDRADGGGASGGPGVPRGSLTSQLFFLLVPKLLLGHLWFSGVPSPAACRCAPGVAAPGGGPHPSSLYGLGGGGPGAGVRAVKPLAPSPGFPRFPPVSACGARPGSSGIIRNHPGGIRDRSGMKRNGAGSIRSGCAAECGTLAGLRNFSGI